MNLNVEWRWLPALASLRPSDRDRLRTAITTLTDEVPAAYEGATVRSGLPALLDDSLKALLVAGSSASFAAWRKCATAGAVCPSSAANVPRMAW